MERDDWNGDKGWRKATSGLTLAIIKVTMLRHPTVRRQFAWIGLDSAPAFPRLQRYLARLAISQDAEIDHIYIQSRALEQAIDLRFDADGPTFQ